LSQTSLKAFSESLVAVRTRRRSSRCARESTKSSTSASLSGGRPWIFSIGGFEGGQAPVGLSLAIAGYNSAVTQVTIAKADVLEIVNELPEDIDVEELVCRLYLREKLAAAEADIAAGRTVSMAEARAEAASWRTLRGEAHVRAITDTVTRAR
jgi:hypothetical protein